MVARDGIEREREDHREHDGEEKSRRGKRLWRHTAIAEENCTELYTYNSRDFGRTQSFTTLTIHIL